MTDKHIITLLTEGWVQFIHACYRVNPEAFDRVYQAINIEHQELSFEKNKDLYQ